MLFAIVTIYFPPELWSPQRWKLGFLEGFFFYHMQRPKWFPVNNAVFQIGNCFLHVCCLPMLIIEPRLPPCLAVLPGSCERCPVAICYHRELLHRACWGEATRYVLIYHRYALFSHDCWPAVRAELYRWPSVHVIVYSLITKYVFGFLMCEILFFTFNINVNNKVLIHSETTAFT